MVQLNASGPLSASDPREVARSDAAFAMNLPGRVLGWTRVPVYLPETRRARIAWMADYTAALCDEVMAGVRPGDPGDRP